jgi:adenine-specific DNA-methyltransferase
MPARKSRTDAPIPVNAFTHADKRANLPTADPHAQDFVTPEMEQSIPVHYDRDPTLDPQLVWKGKEALDSERFVVDAPSIYIQEKIDPRVIIENLHSAEKRPEVEPKLTLFDYFDGLPEVDLVEFYRHQANWSNRLILGDSLNAMASLAQRERLRGKVQMIYIDPPYGIKFNSNWQVSARKRDVKDGRLDDTSREVEQIKAFRDTWELGIHSYLTYLRDRLTVARELLTGSGSIFVQIGDENVHLIRSIMDEVFGAENFTALIAITKSGGGLESTNRIPTRLDYIVWYAADSGQLKYRSLFEERADLEGAGFTNIMLPSGEVRSMTREEKAGAEIPRESRIFRTESLTKPGPGSRYTIEWEGESYTSGNRWWGNPKDTVEKLLRIGRVRRFGRTLRFMRFLDDFGANRLSNLWDGIGGASDPIYVVQTNTKIVERCMLMTTDPGDLILDPTCGSGTSAYVAEQWGRRWITIDTSRVACALARQRLMGARYPYYLLADSLEGREKEKEVTGQSLPPAVTSNDIRHGFVYERIQHVTLSSIANNPDIKEGMNQQQIDASIRRHAESELLYDRPYEDTGRVRVSGPFTVESLSPHRSLAFAGSAVDGTGAVNLNVAQDASDGDSSFEQTILANLRTAGIQNGRKGDRLTFDALESYAAICIQAVGVREDAADEAPKRVGIAIGPQYGTVGPSFIKDAAREANRSRDLDLLCVLAFAFDPSVLGTGEEYVASDVGFANVAAERRLGRVPVLLVRMNADLLMGEELKKTGAGNLFTVFGSPDIEIKDDDGELRVVLHGVDVYDPNTGQIRSDDTDQIALWMIDTSYNEESFFVRHCYFTGGQDPYGRLKRALRSDIAEDAWESLYRTESRLFPRPDTGKIAVKVINDYGDEVMKVFLV